MQPLLEKKSGRFYIVAFYSSTKYSGIDCHKYTFPLCGIQIQNIQTKEQHLIRVYSRSIIPPSNI